MDTIEQAVLDVVTGFVSEDKRVCVSLECDFHKDLGLNSLRLINLVFLLKEKVEFDITRVDDEELKKIATVQDIVNSIKKQTVTTAGLETTV